ncbi:hypothetical protein B5F82_07155 [Megamonas hypermegale]|uniref:HTH domain-containing protein n=1 Tax=Megamonas hypermegale TaxID=158847 RepID=UPI000B376250|nr:HTH domain-containing protein [Megamonas hypermegale]OUO39495.1 hypothetical protein B5F82_07155 [Megamonas hypermegale]
MAGKVFTDEQRELLNKNPYVESVEASRIIYTEAFKVYYVKNYLAGKRPTEIFVSAGFDPSILGNKRIERASARWRKLYADGQLIIDNEEKKEAVDMENKPEKRRRGRPRKNPIVEETSAKESVVAETKSAYEAEPKKRRGRPRKNPVDVEKEVAPTKKRKKRTNKIAAMAQSLKTIENKSNSEEAQIKTEVQDKPEKRRRGRPRKNPIEAPVVENAPKKRRGRPRKNAQPIVSTETHEVKKAPVKVISTAVLPREQETEINERPITALVKAINRLTRQVDSLKRLVAGKKKVNY